MKNSISQPENSITEKRKEAIRKAVEEAFYEGIFDLGGLDTPIDNCKLTPDELDWAKENLTFSIHVYNSEEK